jgi:hypothetical protein
VPGGAVTSWWEPSDNTQHIGYIDGSGHVLHVYVSPGQPPWGIRDVTDDTGGVLANPGSALTTWFSTTDGIRHLAYVDASGIDAGIGTSRIRS